MDKKLRGKFSIYYLGFPSRSGAPELIEIKNAKFYFKGKSVYYKGENDLDYTRRLKVTIIRNATGTIIREDYPLNKLIEVGIKETYPILSKAN
tara:strand:- start:834 stop:1112 length:279 start_codon:yes stop_codon:yes gene_type:complete